MSYVFSGAGSAHLPRLTFCVYKWPIWHYTHKHTSTANFCSGRGRISSTKHWKHNLGHPIGSQAIMSQPFFWTCWTLYLQSSYNDEHHHCQHILCFTQTPTWCCWFIGIWSGFSCNNSFLSLCIIVFIIAERTALKRLKPTPNVCQCRFRHLKPSKFSNPAAGPGNSVPNTKKKDTSGNLRSVYSSFTMCF